MYRLSIYSSPVSFPLCFALHTWIVLESPQFGTNRYEIHYFKNKDGHYLHKNNQLENEGLSVLSIPFLWFGNTKFKSKLIHEVSGDMYKELILGLEQQIQRYTFKNRYILYPGPNSNTFTQWVIEKAGLAKGVQLPKNAFGRI